MAHNQWFISVKCLQCEKRGQVTFVEFACEKRGKAGKSKLDLLQHISLWRSHV